MLNRRRQQKCKEEEKRSTKDCTFKPVINNYKMSTSKINDSNQNSSNNSQEKKVFLSIY